MASSNIHRKGFDAARERDPNATPSPQATTKLPLCAVSGLIWDIQRSEMMRIPLLAW